MKKYFIPMFMFILLVLSVKSYASIIDFEGVITRIYEYNSSTGKTTYKDSSNLFGDVFSLNDVYTGTFTYNHAGTQLGGNENYAVYNHNTIKGITVNIGNYIFDSYNDNRETGYLQIQNNLIMTGQSTDGFSVFDKYYKNGKTESAEFYLFDRSASVYHGLSIPEMINMNDFDTRMFHQSFVDNSGNQLHVFGRTTNFNVRVVNGATPTPEPNTLLLLGVGLLTSTNIVRRWRKK